MNLDDVYISERSRLKQDLVCFFEKERPSTAILNECACLIVKPHAL